MTPAARIQQETARYSDNVLNSFLNFDQVFVWNKVSGGSNAIIQNSSALTYAGTYAVDINFTGTSEVKFNSGSSIAETVIRKTGNYILSYAFFKTDNDADMNFKVEVVINGVVFTQYTFTQNLYDTSGFENGIWNVYSQVLPLNDGDLIDFNFYAQSDTTACKLHFDRLKLELDDRNLVFPSIYSPAPIVLNYQETILNVPSIAGNSNYNAIIGLDGLEVGQAFIIWADRQLTNEGLIISYPTWRENGLINVLIHNHSGSASDALTDVTFYAKIV